MQHSCFVTSSNMPCVTMSRSRTLLRLQHKILKHAHTYGAVGHAPLRSLDKMRLGWLRRETSDGAVLNASDGSVQLFPNCEGRRHQLHNNRMHSASTCTLASIPCLCQRCDCAGVLRAARPLLRMPPLLLQRQPRRCRPQPSPLLQHDVLPSQPLLPQ